MRRQLLCGSLLAVTAALAGPSRADAFILTTRGQTVKHVADLPPALKAEHGDGVAVGYKYRYFGVFWIDLWTWDGEYCLYRDKKALEVLTPARAAEILDVPESELSPPFLYRFPPGLMILSGLAALVVIGSIIDRRTKYKVQLLTEDPKYMRALEVLAEQTRKAEAARAAVSTTGGSAATVAPADAGYEAAVVYLTNEGVPREEAERNLRLILSSMDQTEPAAD